MKLSLSIMATGANNARPLAKIIQQEKVTLGRDENSTLVLPDEHKWISNHHASIDYRVSDYFITDTSTNGVLINQAAKPLGRGNSAKLNDGDQIHIGDYVIEVKLLEASLVTINPVIINPNLVGNKPFTSADPFAELAANALSNINNKSEDPFNWPDSDNKRPVMTDNDFEHISPYKESLPLYNTPESEPLIIPTPAKTASSLIPDNWFADDNASGGTNKAAEQDTTPKFNKPQPPEPKPHRPDPPPPFIDEPKRVHEFSPIEEAKPTSQPALDFSNDLMKNFLQGAGLEDSRYAENLSPESFYIIGKMLRESIQGAQDVLIGRAKIKNEMHLDVTIIKAKENNPIKFSVNAQEALVKLLLSQDKGYLQPEAAIKEAFDDIKAHQYAVIAGMRTALLAVLKRFDPKKLEQRLQEDNPFAAHIPIHKQMKLWDSFERLYKDIEQEAEDNFYHLFGEAFADTYEQQLRNVKKSKPDDIF
jgi:type VI secretion system protein